MKTWNLIVVGVSLVATLVWAGDGRETGNGGLGVRRNGKVYLLDLLEAGREENPFVSDLVPSQNTINRVKNATGLDDTVVSIVATKLGEINTKYPVFSQYLLHAIELHNWRFTNEVLSPSKDNDSWIDIPSGALVQIGLRRTPNIFINQSTYVEMDTNNKSAFVLHEAVYSLIGEQAWAHLVAREFIGTLFGTDLRSSNLNKQLKSRLQIQDLAVDFIEELDLSKCHRPVKGVAISGFDTGYKLNFDWWPKDLTSNYGNQINLQTISDVCEFLYKNPQREIVANPITFVDYVERVQGDKFDKLQSSSCVFLNPSLGNILRLNSVEECKENLKNWAIQSKVITQ